MPVSATDSRHGLVRGKSRTLWKITQQRGRAADRQFDAAGNPAAARRTGDAAALGAGTVRASVISRRAT